jgi:hypothetical protein
LPLYHKLLIIRSTVQISPKKIYCGILMKGGIRDEESVGCSETGRLSGPQPLRSSLSNDPAIAILR